MFPLLKFEKKFSIQYGRFMAIFLSFSSFHRPNGRLATYECVAALSNFRFEHSHPAFLSLQRESVMKNIQKTPNFKVLSDFEFLEASGAARAGR